MKRFSWILVTVIGAVAAFLLGPVLWPPAAGEAGPVGAQLPLLIAVSALESVAFGFGIAFLLFGWPWVRCVAHDSKGIAWGMYLTIAWGLVSWWPHDNMHISNAADDWWRLIGIEYIFHVTLILSAFVLSWCFFHVIRRCQRA